MAYNDTPLAAQAKNASQPLIRQNFQTLQTYLQLNHDSLVTGTGKHTHVTMPVLAAPATAAGELALYSKTVGANTELYMRRDNVATEIPVGGTFAGNATLGYSLLPGGLKMLWGQATTSPANGTVTISTAAGVLAGWPGFTAVPLTQASARFAGGLPAGVGIFIISTNLANLSVQSINTSNGTARPSIGINWLAIGN